MMLKDKVAVIYGAGGAIGGAVVRAFAAEGPSSFSPGTSWHPSKLSREKSVPTRRRRWTLSTSRRWTSICSP